MDIKDGMYKKYDRNPLETLVEGIKSGVYDTLSDEGYEELLYLAEKANNIYIENDLLRTDIVNMLEENHRLRVALFQKRYRLFEVEESVKDDIKKRELNEFIYNEMEALKLDMSREDK